MVGCAMEPAVVMVVFSYMVLKRPVASNRVTRLQTYDKVRELAVSGVRRASQVADRRESSQTNKNGGKRF